MQRQSGVASTVVIILISALSIIGAYYLGFQKGSEKTEQTTSPEPASPSAPSNEKADEEKLKDEAPDKPLVKIPIISTNNWQTITLNGLSFKIPQDAKFEATENWSRDENAAYGLVYYTTETYTTPARLMVTKYNGGSRREQFLGKNPDDCHYIFEDALFGNIPALQIGADGGWCQGGAGGIVAVVGDKLFAYHHLYYELDTKKILRFDKRDTIISTLKKVEE